KPITGRTHQIRVHLQHLGLPVVGDETYDGRAKAVKVARQLKRSDLLQTIQSLNGQALHAWKLTFVHPRTEEPKTFEAPLPDDMRQLIAILALLGLVS
ncbi:MAG: RNA pseudouridine synthase, partial [Armatimonadota bacterium]|nr:RNA pseudouridine synthase [Armatimonadota bacterium]MDW8144394.1 RNA pseudouridine synthase [Armatimonadota bacterium]